MLLLVIMEALIGAFLCNDSAYDRRNLWARGDNLCKERFARLVFKLIKIGNGSNRN